MSLNTATLGTAIYGRISADLGHDAKGVARQIQDGHERIDREPGWTHAGDFVDNDLSATKGKHRPRFQALMEAVRRGDVRVIVCYMTGRLLRNRRERAEAFQLFAERSVRVVCTGGQDLDFSTPAGRVLAGILGEFDTYEVEQLGDRVSRAHRQAAEEGRPSGGRCYGYRPDPTAPKYHKKRLIVEDEAAVIRDAKDRVLRGESQESIVARLNERGIKPLRAERWTASVLKGMLLNPTIAGRRVYRGEDVGEADWKPIISHAEHVKLAGLLTKRAMPEGWSPRNVHLLSGICLCGKCAARGRRVKLVCRAERAGSSRAYTCQDKSRGGCRGLRHAADFVDDFVEGTVIDILGEPGVVGELMAAGAPDADEVLDVVRGIDSVKAQAVALGVELAKPGTSEIRKIMIEAQAGELEAELTRLRRREAAMSRSTAAEGLIGVDDVGAHWRDGMTLSQRRAVISALVEITLLPIGCGKRATPDHIKIERRRLA